jgi:acyl-CoA reductase-like NAD-dependent aldehyde dehydrogenase
VTDRLAIRKTYKLYIDGDFPRSESGRSYEVYGPDGSFLANAVRASRKDLRDAVRAARKSWPKWSGSSGYNRGQVLYRVAEMMEARRNDLIAEVGRAEEGDGERQVDEATDTWVWYAGWTDKLSQTLGGLNEVAGPYFNITAPEATGVVGIVAPESPSLLGLVGRLAPALCAGNAVVVIASEKHPLPAIALSECMATADVPGGIANVLTGLKQELVSVMAAHGDVDAIDVTGVVESELEETERAAAGNVKRIVRAKGERSPYEVTSFMDMKTVWHPKGP